MANKDNNNLVYGILLVVGLLLLLIPFLLFDLSGPITLLGHLGRLGLHIAAFVTALVAGSLFSVAVTKSASVSIGTLKIAAVTTAVIIGTGITYNAINYTQKSNSIALSDSIIIQNELSLVSIDSMIINSDTSSNEGTISSIASDTNAIETQKTEPIQPAAKEKNTSTISENNKTTTTVIATPSSEELIEQCNSFKVLQGTQLLDRKLGLSIYDPNKMIRFNNDCGCILKDAIMSVRRDGKVLEQKSQSGNYINWRGFKDINAGDKLEIEIKQANCKNKKGLGFLYTFPKAILTIIYISDHMQFEGADSKSGKTTKAKESVKEAPEKTIQKDKIEEDANKFGN